MRIVRSTLIGTAVAMALFGRNGAAQAETPATPAESPATPGASNQNNNGLEEIVVTSYRRSLEAGMENKRDATAISEVLMAEDVGKFPDKNVAEALQRVPGIVTQRDFGEGERINLRGTLTTLTKTTLNGHSLSTADWFILDQQAATRSFNYLILPADLIGQVNVVKTAQADMEEGGIGGTVDVRTRKPLDLDQFTAFASVEAAHTATSGKTDPYGTALLSFKSKDETIGFLIAGIYQERHLQRNGFEILGYNSLAATAPGSTDPTLIPTQINQALFLQDRIREGGNFDVQLKPNDQLEINFSGLLSILQAENFNNSWYTNAAQALGQGGTLTGCVNVQGACAAGTISSTDGGTTGVAYNYDAFHRLAKVTSNNLDLNTRYTPNEQWTVTADLGYTQATGNTDPQYLTEFQAPGVFSYDLTRGISQMPLPNSAGHTVNFANPNDWQFNFGNDDIFTNDDRETYGYVDAEAKLDLGLLKSIKFGAKFTDHQRDAAGIYTAYGTFSAPLTKANTNTAAFSAGSPGNFLSGIASPGSVTQFWQVNQNYANNLFANQELVSGRIPYPIQGFSVNEKTYGTYVMGTFADNDRWRGNVGVRLAHTEERTSGALTVSPAQANDPGVVNNPFGPFIPAQATKTYNDVLPSLNFTYNIRPDFLARFAAAKVMSRPDFNAIVPLVSLSPGALSGTAGNPALNPYRATQEDLSFEWYPNRDTAYTLAFFYKDLKTFVEDRAGTQFFPLQNKQAPSAACTTINAATNLFNCPFTIDNKVNTDGGTLKGVELGITQPIWGGFGITANYSYADATLRDNQPFPGASKNTYNFTAFYENSLLSARVSWTQRSSFFLTFDRTSNLFEDALTSLDVSAAYNVTNYLAVTFEAQNLTNNKVIQYDDVISHPRAIYENGRVYFAGVKMRL